MCFSPTLVRINSTTTATTTTGHSAVRFLLVIAYVRLAKPSSGLNSNLWVNRAQLDFQAPNLTRWGDIIRFEA